MKKIGEVAAAAAEREFLRQVDAWLDQGLYLHVNDHLDDLRRLGGVEAGLRIVRALRYLGAEREADALSLRLGRQSPDNAEAMIGMLRTWRGNRGAAAFLRLAQRLGQLDAIDARPALLSLRGLFLAEMRDAEASRACHQQALALEGSDPWLWVEWSYSLTQQDRYAEALEAADRALALCPGYRSALQQRASLLVLLDRRDEAIQVLEQACRTTECSSVALQLESLKSDAGCFEESLELLDLAERWMPLADRQARSRLAARRADSLMGLGRWDEARNQAVQVAGTGFYSRMAERLAQGVPVDRSRRLLPLDFVRQHWSTCAPATLASLCRFWQRPAEHLEIAQAICYDGTPKVSERLWAEQQGFVVVEFSVDWPTSCRLLDAGLPFALATLHAGGGHLQAVVGYDPVRETLLIRDPYQPVHAEFEATGLFDGRYADGPRGLLLLPAEARHRIEGLPLPDVEVWDRLHAVQAALERHDRDVALTELAALRAAHAEHLLCWRAQRALAIYDGAESEILACTEALLERHPNDVNLQLSKASSLASLAGEQALESYLLRLVDVPAPEPLLLTRLASRWADDGRRLPEALTLLARALRRAPAQGRLWAQWAVLVWRGGDREASLPLYRWASTLQPVDEDAAEAYARGCRIQGHVEQGLDYLRGRAEAWGDRSGAPSLTLAEQLSVLGRGDEAEQVLEAALKRRPADADLQVQVAEFLLRRGKVDEARQLLDAVQGPVRRASLERARTQLAEAEGRYEQALAHASAAVLLDPLSVPLHRAVLRLQSRLQGRQQALAWLTAQADRYPAHYGLQTLLYDWLGDDLPAAQARLKHLEGFHADDPWLRRELASLASRQGRHDEALALAERACAGAPDHAQSFAIQGYVLLRREGYAAAAPALRKALTLDIDHDYSLRTLINTAPDVQLAREAAEFVVAELLRQVTTGEGLLTFQSVAGRLLPPAEVQVLLERACAERPDLWQSWVALARQLIESDQPASAHELLQRAAARFQSLPRLHLELAESLRLMDRRDEALLACERALQLSPGWNQAVRLHVDLLGETGSRWTEAEQSVRRALEREPSDDDLVGLLAWLLHRQRRLDEALAEVRRSVAMNPKLEWVWRLARAICEDRERLADYDSLLDEVCSSRPGDVWAWVVLAEQHRDDFHALAACERAIQLEPRTEAAWLARFERLARLSRHEELERLMTELPWPAPAPLALRAWGDRLEWRRGEAARAIERRRELLKEAPHDFELWRELADWLDERDDHAGYEAASIRLRDLAPARALAHGYLGHALLKLERHGESIEALRQAIRIDPSYRFAIRCQVEAARCTSDKAVVEEGLDRLWQLGPQVQVAADGILNAVALGDQALALRWLERLCSCEEFDIDLSVLALAAMREAGWGRALQAMQQKQLDEGDGPAGICSEWLQHLSGRYTVLWALYRLQRRMREGRGSSLPMAALRWVRADCNFALGWFIRKHGPRLRGIDLCWGEVSFALMCDDRHAAVLAWTADWRQRPKAPLWALSNRCACAYLVGVKRGLAAARAEMAELVAAGLERGPYNEDFRLWELVLAAHDGRLDELKQGLQRRHEWKPDEWMRSALDSLAAFEDAARMETWQAALKRFDTLLPGSWGVGLANRIRMEMRRLLQLRSPQLPAWRRKLLQRNQ